MTTEPFTQGSGPCLPENIDVSVATALDYFNLLFKPEIFSDIKDHTNNYVISKQEEIWRNTNNPDYVDSIWQETTAEELKALFGIHILMGLNPLPQCKLYWHQNDFTGNSGVKKTMTCRRYQKLSRYLHVADRANEPAQNGADYDKLYKIHPVLNMARTALLKATSLDKIKQLMKACMPLMADLVMYNTYLPNKSQEELRYGCAVMLIQYICINVSCFLVNRKILNLVLDMMW